MKSSVSKKFKITKTGKILHRKMGLSHFRAKKSGKQLRRKKALVRVTKILKKTLQKYS